MKPTPRETIVIKTMTTRLFMEIAEESTAAGYNRMCSSDMIRELVDPRAIHVLEFDMVHEHKNGRECEPHQRCQFWVGMLDQAKPELITIDMSMERFASLPTITYERSDTGTEVILTPTQ